MRAGFDRRGKVSSFGCSRLDQRGSFPSGLFSRANGAPLQVTGQHNMRRRVRQSVFAFFYRRRMKPWSQFAFRRFAALRPVDRPIFIVGMNRSGTSFLRDCVSTSPEIACWDEMNEMWDPLGYPWESARRPRPHWTIEPASYIDATSEDVGAAYYRAVPGMCSARACAERGWFAKFRFLNKCPMNTLRIPLLLKLFPDAVFISVVRNPLAVIRSWTQKAIPKLEEHPRSGIRQNGHGEMEYTIDGVRYSWIQVVEKAAKSHCHVVERHLDDLSQLPESRKYQTRYEDFLQNIHGVIREIDARFDLDSSLRPWSEIPASQASRNHKYQEQFDQRTREVILRHCQPLMHRLNYVSSEAA